MRAMLSAMILATLAAIASAAITAHQIPPTGWTVEGVVVKVVDGDTVDIEIRQVVRVRLDQCWAPETKIDDRVPKEKQAAEKRAGIESKEHLKQLADGKEVVLHVPIGTNLKDSLTLNRVVGTVWLDGSEKSLNEIQVETGHATKEKREELRK